MRRAFFLFVFVFLILLVPKGEAISQNLTAFNTSTEETLIFAGDPSVTEYTRYFVFDSSFSIDCSSFTCNHYINFANISLLSQNASNITSGSDTIDFSSNVTFSNLSYTNISEAISGSTHMLIQSFRHWINKSATDYSLCNNNDCRGSSIIEFKTNLSTNFNLHYSFLKNAHEDVSNFTQITIEAFNYTLGDYDTINYSKYHNSSVGSNLAPYCMVFDHSFNFSEDYKNTSDSDLMRLKITYTNGDKDVLSGPVSGSPPACDGITGLSGGSWSARTLKFYVNDAPGVAVAVKNNNVSINSSGSKANFTLSSLYQPFNFNQISIRDYINTNCAENPLCRVPITFTSSEPFEMNYTNIFLSVVENITAGNIFFKDEENDNLFSLTKSNITFTSICPNQEIKENVTTNPEGVSITCSFTYLRGDFSFTNGDYFRTIIPSPTQENNTFYMADLTKRDVVQVILRLDDLTGDFGTGSRVKIERVISSGRIIITEQYFNAEKKVILYLIKDQPYSLTVISPTGETRSIGEIISSVAEEKTIVIPEIIFYPQDQTLYTNLTFRFEPIPYNSSLGYIKLIYSDTSSLTTWVNWTIRRENLTGPLVHDTGLLGSQTFTSQFNGVAAGQTYVSIMVINHSNLGILRDVRIFTDQSGGIVANLDAFEKPDEWLKWGGLFVIILLGLSATAGNAAIVLSFTSVILLIFVRQDWIIINPYTLAIMFIIVGLNFYKASKTNEEVST